jgi:NADH:ubiquinone oxidoreductase subunit 2 (subunit N)
MMNAGGLPPFSGFIIKLKALLYIKKKIALLFVSARAVALSCYSRIILNNNYSRDKVRTVTFITLVVGIV